ncbi:unnamed protein product [Meloidogyne enterolobii]|uniref:Uncharacterized protein n=1 Tax=Meloidogyne enterolobii TaxID=390850 RepID=A0ACB0XLJ0_MELEN
MISNAFRLSFSFPVYDIILFYNMVTSLLKIKKSGYLIFKKSFQRIVFFGYSVNCPISWRFFSFFYLFA